MIDIQNKIILLDDQSQLGQKELDALIEANAADINLVIAYRKFLNTCRSISYVFLNLS